ncbi:hypothetical protein DDE19_18325 [Micromonospora ureilytica]|uniref:Transposase IS4-like domain-containing protein n=1 Tax=Micromonospora ureilytica TaxID=709868 RepID=A0A3N9XRM3_9ACTN|nr:hypothetical protein DDE19_18325 [Micromonospora ureilytica]
MTDAGGIPLAASLTGGNRHDVTHLLPLKEDLGRPRRPCTGGSLGQLYRARRHPPSPPDRRFGWFSWSLRL